MRTKLDILQDDDEVAFLGRCFFDFSFFCERVLGLQIKDFHKEWCNALMNENRLAIAAPTGFGKTQIFGIAFPLWLAFFYPGSKSLIISKSIRTQSSSVLEQIKHIIQTNEMLQSLRPTGDEARMWTKEKIICSNNAQVFYSSYSVNTRGVHVDYIFGDEVASYPDRSDNYNIWFREIVSRCSDSGIFERGKIAAVSTPIDSGDLLSVLISGSRGYYSKMYPAIVDYSNGDYSTGKSIWSERFPLSKLIDMRKEQGIGNFERNIMVNPKAEAEGSIFKLKDLLVAFDYDRVFTNKLEDKESLVIIGCDFAMSDGPQADFDAYVVLEKMPSGKVIVKHMETWKGIGLPDKERKLLELAQRFKPYQFVLDESNVGGDMIRRLTNAGYSAVGFKFSSVSRKDLLVLLKNIVDRHDLILPYHPEEPEQQMLVNLVVEQLIGFKEDRSGKSGMPTYVSKAAHDDLAISLALACKGAEEMNLQEDVLWSG